MTKEEVEAIVQEKMDEINHCDYSKYEALIRRMDNHGKYIETLQDAVLEFSKGTVENGEHIKFLLSNEVERLERENKRLKEDSESLTGTNFLVALMIGIPILMLIWLNTR